MRSQLSSLLDIYRKAAMGHPNELSLKLWGEIPSSYRLMKKTIGKRRTLINLESFNENIEVFRSIILDRHRKLGTLTDQIREALNQLDKGFLDVGHQPLLFGGPLFLINKISLAEWLGKYLDISSYFFIGDHDSIQNELTISRFPQANSPTGLEITPLSWDVPLGTPIHKVPLPKQTWLQEVKQKIQDNLRQLMKYAKIRVEYRQLLLERFYSWFDLIYDNTISTDDFSLWTQKIWSQLFNLRNNMSLFLGPESDIKYRKLVLPAFEFLLTEKNRLCYIETLNAIRDKIISHNLVPGLPYREEGYVPFFLECLKCTFKTRVELKILKPNVLEGKCPVCSEEYSFSYNEKHPDLTEVELSISPRSDSRAMVNNFTLPLLAHIGGAGETRYYSAVIPAMKRLRISPPILIRSNRIHYNTPWAEKSAKTRENLILSREVYNIFDGYNRSTEIQKIQSALENMRGYLNKKYKDEVTELYKQQKELEANPQNSELRKSVKKIELMLSHNFGFYTHGKKASELSWNWLDLAVLTGIHRITDIFQRQLKETAFPGYTWYITPGKFT
ncbi:MAG: bacillithiol biosynthesis BshC [Candidatus Hodarchaeota archaeon]